MDWIREPWPWYVAGPILALVYALLVWFGRSFGVSGALRTACAALGAGRGASFFKYDWKSETWNLLFLLGTVIGGFIGMTWMRAPQPLDLAAPTQTRLDAMGLTSWRTELAPVEFVSWGALGSSTGLVMLVLGGFLVGFGSRWAGGCTSGHAISGLANLQIPSLVAVCGFFAGGLLVTHLVFPILFR